MKENYIFTQTASGDRTNIMSTFPLWNKEMFIEHVKGGKGYGRYRCGAIGGYMRLLKDMSLEEFDKVFHPEEFTKEEITELFRKEISLKYGEHADKVKIKGLSKKELERGCVYKDVSGTEWLYLGEVEETIDRDYLVKYQAMKKRPVEVKTGYGFTRSYRYSTGIDASRINVLKAPKKLVSKVEGVKIDLKPEYVHETGKMYYDYREARTTIKLL